jgi:hypothetical protein
MIHNLFYLLGCTCPFPCRPFADVQNNLHNLNVTGKAGDKGEMPVRIPTKPYCLYQNLYCEGQGGYHGALPFDYMGRKGTRGR